MSKEHEKFVMLSPTERMLNTYPRNRGVYTRGELIEHFRMRGLKLLAAPNNTKLDYIQYIMNNKNCLVKNI